MGVPPAGSDKETGWPLVAWGQTGSRRQTMATPQHLSAYESPESAREQRLPTHGANPRLSRHWLGIQIKKIPSGAFKESSQRGF